MEESSQVDTHTLRIFQTLFWGVLVIAIVLTSAVAYFINQNAKLSQDLLSLKLMVDTSSGPTANTNTNTDTTTNWETYTNNEKGYSIKFPKENYTQISCTGEEFTATKSTTSANISPATMTSCERDGRYDIESKTYASVQDEPIETKYYTIVKKDVQMGGISGKLYIHTFTGIEDGPYPAWYALARVNKNNKTYEIYFGDKDKLDLFNQILSTFTFIN